MAFAFGVGASEQVDRRASAQRGLDGLRVALSLCGFRPSAGRTASRGAEALRASVMDYRRLLMSRVVPGQFDDADSSDRWASPFGHTDSVRILLSPPPRAASGFLRETGISFGVVSPQPFASFSMPAGSFNPLCAGVHESHLSREFQIG